MANIKEIAKLANVSVATVSRVLNNHPYVSEEKRRLVNQVMKELDYTPNRTAIDLIRGKTNTIGVILPYSDHPCFDKIVNGITKEAFAHDYVTTLLPTNYDPAIEITYFELLKMKKIDGLIVTSRANEWETAVPYLEYGPIVACEYIQHQAIPCAYNDRQAAYRESFLYLKNRGHRDVAFTCVREAAKSPSTTDKVNAYKAVFGSFDESRILIGCHDMDDGKRAGEHFRGFSKPPTAIYAHSDDVAAGLYQFAKEQKWDVEIIGEGNVSVSRALNIPSLELHLERVGKEAFLLFLNGETAKKQIMHQFQRKKT